MAVERITFDTNILFYALDTDGADKHVVSAALLRSARQAESVLLLQSLAELYSALRKQPNIAPTRAQEFIENNMQVFPVVAIDQADLLFAISLQQRRQMHFWDALLIATALRVGCTVFLSEDGHHGQTFDGLRVINPFLVSESERASFFRI